MSTQPQPVEPPLSHGLVNTIAGAINRGLSTGDVAELRRLKPGEVSCAAFWRIATQYLAPSLPPGGPPRDEAERRWAVILQAMAQLRDLHAPAADLGRALAHARVTEARVVKLLRVHGNTLAHEVRVIAHFLTAKDQHLDCYGLALLVLSDGRRNEEKVRRDIARDFYKQLEKIEKENR